MGEPIRTLIIEDNMLTRAGLASVLKASNAVTVAGEANSGEEGVAQYEVIKPDVVVTDLRMPGMDGVAVVKTLVEKHADARVLVLTHYDGEENIFRAVQAGALGYVTKDADAGVLLEAIAAVAAGNRFLPGEIAAKFAERSMGKGLSPREQQVIEWVQTGLANKQIAEKLGLSDKTIQLYVATIMEKLGAQSRTEAVAIALERGILMPPR